MKGRKDMEKIILASASPRRRELLELAGIPFEVIVSEAEEVITRKNPGEVVEELSLCKAQAVAEHHPDRLVLGADTIVVRDGEILGKPRDEADAKRMLEKLRGRTHQVYTGVTLIKGKKKHSFHEMADVEVYPMSEEEIEDYIRTGEPMDKAGAYGIQGRFGIYIKEIKGEYNTIVGLPIARVCHELSKI